MVKRPLSAFPEFGGLEPISGALIGELQAFWMTLIAKQGMGVKRGGGLKPRDVALVDLGIEKQRSERWYNIKRIPDDCFDPLLKIVPEIFTSDFLAASKLAVLAPNSHHKEVAALEIGQSSIIASRNNCATCRAFAARLNVTL